MRDALRPLVWLGSSRTAVQPFPKSLRLVVGHELFQVQQGLEPTSWKPMPSVGPGVVEPRVRLDGAFRVLYAANREEGIYVLHAFQKRTRKTARMHLDLARKRFRNLENWRGHGP